MVAVAQMSTPSLAKTRYKASRNVAFKRERVRAHQVFEWNINHIDFAWRR